MTLGEFLRAECANNGHWHCSTMPADWCKALGHPDFASAWRDVTDFDECEAIQADAGGLLNLWELGIGSGLPHVTGDLAMGDIAVIRVGATEAGAIWTGERWAAKAGRGVHFLAKDAATVVRAWRP